MEFLTYKTLHDQNEVEVLVQSLKDNGIEFELAEDRDSLDSLYGDKHLTKRFFVKLRAADFRRANAMLETVDESDLTNISADHYLFAFTDEELFDLLSKPDEWNALDYKLAKKILRERGREVDDNVIDTLKKQRLIELAKPDQGSDFWTYAGYIFALCGGIIGIFIGISLMTSKKNLPDGQRVYTYSAADRKHGTVILVIGAVMFVIITAVKIARLI